MKIKNKNNENKIIAISLFIILSLFGIIFSHFVFANNGDVVKVVMDNEKANILSKYGLGNWSSTDFPKDRGFIRCLRGIGENIDTLNYCSEIIFQTRDEADEWEKNKMESIANYLIIEDRKKRETLENGITIIKEVSTK